MTPDDYAEGIKDITASAVRNAGLVARQFVSVDINYPLWRRMAQLMYTDVEHHRYQAAKLARSFYDEERQRHVPELPRNDQPLERYEFDWFLENLEPTRQQMSRMDSDDNAVAHVMLQVAKEVENAARKQIIHAVENDDDLEDLISEQEDDDFSDFDFDIERDQISDYVYRNQHLKVRGWARVATGRETCAWCLMLISRGPVYKSAKTAGLNLSKKRAKEMLAGGEDVSEHMQEWHTGCDCKVVPVFKHVAWFGQEASDNALDMWNQAGEEAQKILRDKPRHKQGKRKGQLYTLNELTINTLRRRLDRGDIDPTGFAALRAA